jgi:glycosyltransferase involved in cell wall biosynthesis
MEAEMNLGLGVDTETLRLSAVVPVYNEKENVVPLVEELAGELSRIGAPFEILLVDDGSTDGSGEILDRIAGSTPHVRALHLDRNRGQSAATAAGFEAARGEYIVTLDADRQNDPCDISRLLEWIPQYDMVAGYRRERRDSWLRRASSVVANRVRSRVLGDGIRDTGCSLKLFRRDLTPRMPRFNGLHRFLPLLVQLQGGTVTQIPVNHRARTAGTSKYGVRNRLFRGLFDLIGMVWLKRRYVRYAVGYEMSSPARSSQRQVRAGKEEA